MFFQKPAFHPAILLLIFTLALHSCQEDGDEDETPPSSGNDPVLAAFDLLYVNNNSIDVAFTPSLVWEPSSNQDGDEIKYTLLLDRTVDLDVGEDPTTVVEADLTANFFTITQPLLQSTEYKWCVVAGDSDDNEQKSTSVFTFTTGAIDNQPPNPFDLLIPADLATNQPTDVQLFWETATDPEGDPITYDVYVGLSPNPFTIVSSTQSPTNYMNNNLAESTTYYWRVVAKDGKGGYTISDSEFEFTTSGAPNSIPGTANVVLTGGRPVTGTSPTYDGTRGHQVVIFNGEIYDTAGWSLVNNDGREGNDVYKSADGVNWSLVRGHDPNDETGFFPSEEHAVVAHNGQLYMFEGNRNLIKSSSDGQFWNNVDWTGSVLDNTHYLPRNNHQAVSYNGALYLIGGISNGVIKTDVWRSNDNGSSWTEIKPSDNSSWIGSTELRVEVHDGYIWLFDGGNGPAGTPCDLWRSADGVNWQMMSTVPFTATRGFATAVYKNGIAVVSGSFDNEIWWTGNGTTWTQVILTNPQSLSWRRDHDAYVFNGELYVSYGRGNNSGPELRSDIVQITFEP